MKLKETLIKSRPELLVSDKKVYDEISKKAVIEAKKAFPNDKDKMIIAGNMYLLGMIDTVNMIYT